jgi:hypothetical protein
MNKDMEASLIGAVAAQQGISKSDLANGYGSPYQARYDLAKLVKQGKLVAVKQDHKSASLYTPGAQP